MQHQLFVDLDGVLVNFCQGVKRITGKLPTEMPPHIMWPLLAKAKSFYENLDWMPGGKQLWKAIKNLKPIILTGLPADKWAEPQKRSWCKRELGQEVPVITGFSREKTRLAQKWLRARKQEHLCPVLIDDRHSLQEPWEAEGGTFVLHMEAKQTLKELQRLNILS